MDIKTQEWMEQRLQKAHDLRNQIRLLKAEIEKINSNDNVRMSFDHPIGGRVEHIHMCDDRDFRIKIYDIVSQPLIDAFQVEIEQLEKEYSKL